MGTTTTTFALNKPTVGGDDNAWGSALNDNADKLDDLLDGTTAIKPNLSEGLWKVGGTAITATAAEINYIDGVTSAIQTQLDAKQALDADLTAIAGLSSNGLVARTGAGTAAARTVTAGTGITVTDGDGVAGNPTVAATLASQAEAEAGTDNAKLMTPLRAKQSGRYVWSASQATTSGTAFDFTGIPAGVAEVEIACRNVALNGADSVLVQLGTSGGFVTTGYESHSYVFVGGSNAATGVTNAIIVTMGATARPFTGSVRLIRTGGNNWLATIVGGNTTSAVAHLGGGNVTLSGDLTQVRLTRALTSSFNAGSAIVGYR